MRRTSVFDGQRGLIIAIFVASFCLNLLTLTVPLYMLQLFSRVLSSGSIPTLVVLSIGAGIALLFYFLFDTIRQRLTARLGTRLEARLGPTVLSILVQAASATDRRGTQPIRDLHEVRRFVTGPAFTALLDAPWSILFIGVIFVFDPLLGWIATGGVLLLLLLGILSEFTGRRPDEAAAEAQKSANDIAEEILRNADAIRAMGKTPAVIDRWKNYTFVSIIQSTLAVDRVAMATSLARFVRQGLQILILAAGVTQVLIGDIAPGVMIVASILLARAAAPVEQSIAGWRALLGARAAVKRLNVMLGAIANSPPPIELPQPEGHLSVESATVVLPNVQDPLIFDVGFDLRPGDSLGLIGPSGAGKSTLARTIVGLQPLSRGFVRIDGAALTDWPPEQIGRHIGFLPQRIELFDGTIAENIAMMDPGASPSAVVEAAKLAEVHDLILSLPGGYNAPVGLRGELLSSGQRQRVALARALYGEKKIVVLDEPNSNLDPEGEEALSRAIRKATQRGTVVIIITHRLGILRQLRYAGLMSNGRLARFGEARDVINLAASPMSSGQYSGDQRVAVLNPKKGPASSRPSTKTGGA